jgi:hypothetical protein
LAACNRGPHICMRLLVLFICRGPISQQAARHRSCLGDPGCLRQAASRGQAPPLPPRFHPRGHACPGLIRSLLPLLPPLPTRSPLPIAAGSHLQRRRRICCSAALPRSLPLSVSVISLHTSPSTAVSFSPRSTPPPLSPFLPLIFSLIYTAAAALPALLLHIRSSVTHILSPAARWRPPGPLGSSFPLDLVHARDGR